MFTRIAAVVITLTFVTASFGLVIDPAGHVADWNLTPNLTTQTNQANVVTTNLLSTYANDYAPIKYPNAGRKPSGGEQWDMEEMHARVTPTGQMQVLVVTSSGFSGPARNNNTVYLGDLFFTINDQQFAMVTQSDSMGLTAGNIYRIDSTDDVQSLQDIGPSYHGNNKRVTNDYGPKATIEEIAGPWAVHSSIDPAQLIGTGTIATASFDYGGDEDGTHFTEYTIDASLFAIPVTLGIHQTYGCGNDVIRIDADFNDIPEPASAMLVGMGMLMMLKRNRKA